MRHFSSSRTRKPLQNHELRELWERNPTPELRLALHEIHRLHGLLVGISKTRDIIDKSYKDMGGGHLVALDSLRRTLLSEPGVNDYRPPPPREPEPEDKTSLLYMPPNYEDEYPGHW